MSAPGATTYSKVLGCVSCDPSRLYWNTVEGYNRLVALCAERQVTLLTSLEEWLETCTNDFFKPRFECKEHPGDVIDTTSINNFVINNRLGCKKCYNKTETKLFEWLQKQHPSWLHNELKLTNPLTGRKGAMSVDFTNPVLRLALELDGNIKGGHFDPDPDNTCPVRDLEKEIQLRAKGYQVLRVLQEDVWDDKNGWESWLLGEIKRWGKRAQGAPAEAVRHPDAPEYLGGIYARLRRAVATESASTSAQEDRSHP